MFFIPILIGFIFGFIVFIFMYIASKRSGKYHLAPFATFLAAVLLTMYGLFIVGGFEGMAYGLLGFGCLIMAIVGTLVLPSMLRKGAGKKEFTRKDKVSLFLLPVLLIGLIFALVYSDKNHWIIEEGTFPSSEISVEGYTTSTISEGSKMVYVRLGEVYEGKSVQVEKVTQRGATTVILAIEEGGKEQEVPFIKIGLDVIKEPLTVKTSEGVVIKPVGKK